MIIRGRPFGNRRGGTALECALVYPVALLLLLGTIVIGLGIFQYQQLQALAREGARYASVHGPAYKAATGNSEASTTSVLTYLDGLEVGLNGFNCTNVSYSATTLPCTVTVTLTYTWKPAAVVSSTSWTLSSTMPVTY